MKAISLWQPWASLIACGVKPFETRRWAPPRDLIGQEIAILAAKKIERIRPHKPKGNAEFTEELVRGEYGQDVAAKLAESVYYCPDELMAAFGSVELPIGCVVATAILDAAFHLGEPAKGTAIPAATVLKRMTSHPLPPCFTVRYDDFGDYSPGRWAWLFREVKPLRKPVPMLGRQRFFNIPDDMKAAA